MSTAEIYSSAPLSYIEGIPVFSRPDRYNENYEQISADHLKFFEKEGRNPFIDEAHWRDCENSTAALIEEYARDGDRILDVGVGMGGLLARFPRLTRYGVDISTGYLRYAKSQGIDVCYSRIEDLPYRPDLFDVVTCTDVLEHVLDLNLALRRILAVVKPGGKFIIRVPYREDLSCYLVDGYPYEYVHLRNFDENNLRLLIERIFAQKVAAEVFAGYRAGRLRYGSGIPKLEVVTKLFLNAIEKHLISLAAPIAVIRSKVFTATEINVVVVKQ